MLTMPKFIAILFMQDEAVVRYSANQWQLDSTTYQHTGGAFISIKDNKFVGLRTLE